MAQNKKVRPRTYARNRMVSRRGNEVINEPDSVFFLKLVSVVLLSTLWLKFNTPLQLGDFSLNALPAGALVAIIFIISFEKYQFNRKIWYAVMIVVTIICYFIPAGIVV